ncbi:phosphomethylpyrimidine synthase ThiC [Neomoorella mulderi]
MALHCGTTVTDLAAGYDHINAGLGRAISAWAGADYYTAS